MEKQKWVRPQAIVQEFVANEYVAACGDSGTIYKFECNAGNRYKSYYIRNSKGEKVQISGYKRYHPCYVTHEAPSNSGFLTGYHIDDTSTREDENISVIIWTDNNTDVHCTTKLDMSTWETAKS